MKYGQWAREFHPVKNPHRMDTAINGYVFLQHGKDLTFVREQPSNQIWTFIVSDEGRRPMWLIADGFHVVNAMGYLVTRKPFDDNLFYEVKY